MFKSFMRNSVFAIAAVAGISAAIPAANARDFGDPDVIYIDREMRGIHGEMRRPYRDILSEREIVRVLRDYGYRDIREISLRGDRYRVIAVRRNGAVVKLRVSAFSGNILSEVRVGWVRYRPMEDRYPRPPRPHRHDGSGFSIEFGWDPYR